MPTPSAARPESWIPPSDPVQGLIDITSRGLYSRIRYRSGSRESETTRVIEPRQILETAQGRTLRGMQIEPDRGIRSFAVFGITWVEPDDRPIPEADLERNTFARGSAVTVELKPIAGAARVTTPAALGRPVEANPGPAASAWGQPWFTHYVGAVRSALVDLSVPPSEAAAVRALQAKLNLQKDQIRAAHCFILAEELLALSVDGLIDDREEQRLAHMLSCLKILGWPMQV